MNTTETRCEVCQRRARTYNMETTSYEETVRTYYDTVYRCGYHARNSRFVDYTEVEN